MKSAAAPVHRDVGSDDGESDGLLVDGDWEGNNDGWLDYDVSECEWYSDSPVELVCEGDVYRRLHLVSNGLVGTIPSETSGLSG